MTLLKNNLSVAQTLSPFPVRFFTRFFTWLNDVIVFRRIKRSLNFSGELYVWQFDFNRFVYRPKSSVDSIYHIADPYMHAWSDLILARKAKLVVCTSPKYVDYYNSYVDSKKVLHIPHGVSEEEFELSVSEVNRIKKDHGSFFLLIGSLNDDIDYSLMNEVASKVKLVVLGSEKMRQEENQLAWKRLKTQANIEYLGTIPARELKHYIASAKCCLLLYKFNLKKTIGTGSPLKVMNYLAQYKPVVTSIDPEIPQLINCAIYWANNEQEFLKKCEDAVKGELPLDKVRVKELLGSRVYSSLILRIVGML